MSFLLQLGAHLLLRLLSQYALENLTLWTGLLAAIF